MMDKRAVIVVRARQCPTETTVRCPRDLRVIILSDTVCQNQNFTLIGDCTVDQTAVDLVSGDVASVDCHERGRVILRRDLQAVLEIRKRFINIAEPIMYLAYVVEARGEQRVAS